MKILYLTDTELDTSSGVAQKILMQSNAWNQSGHEVDLLSLVSLSFFSLNTKRLTNPKISIKRKGFNIFFHLILSTWKLREILKSENYDIVYMRYRLYAPFLKSALQDALQIVEINTDDINEYKFSSKLLDYYNRVFRKFFLKNVDAFVSVSHELKEKFLTFSKPITVIGNGIDTQLYSYEESSLSKKPSLVFIGSPNQKWHGLNKIEFLAKRLKEFNFYVIGTEGKDTKNLFYCGYLATKKAQDIIKKQDVGIGTLSLYENKMDEASPLKTRQYFAHGLSVIYAYLDTDIDREYEFTLRLPNNIDNISENIEVIKSFVFKVYKNSDIRKSSRQFSEKKLDVKAKEEKRVVFFEELLKIRTDA